MITCNDLDVQSTSAATIIESQSPISGPPLQHIQLDWRGCLSVVSQDTGGDLHVVIYGLSNWSRVGFKQNPTSTVTETNLSPPDANVAAFIQRLNSLRQLQHGWDGDEAPEPSAVAIRLALEIATLSHTMIQRWPDEVDPDAVGGIALWFYDKDGSAIMVGIRNDGRSAICSYRQNSPIPDVKIVSGAVLTAAAIRASLRSR